MFNTSLQFFTQVFFPALTIWPVNPNYGHGWKLNYTDCAKTTEEDFINCLSKVGYSTKDIFKNQPNIKITPFFISMFDGIAQSLRLDPSVISNHLLGTLVLKLNHSLSYNVYIMDPKLQYNIGTPEGYPRSFVVLKPNAGIVYFYLKVQHLK